MKITLLPTIGLSGGVKIVFKYANNLVDRGHEVEVVYPKLLASQLLLTLIKIFSI